MTKRKKLSAILLGAILALGVGAGVGASRVETGRAAVETYEEVTSAQADWSGEYLIVSKTDNVAFNGDLATLDAVSNTVAVAITAGKISLDSKYSFEIIKNGTNYDIKSASGYFIYGKNTNANGLDTNTEANTIKNDLSYDSGVVKIKSTGTISNYLVYNSTSGQTRFRYFKSTTSGAGLGSGLYHAVSLFKKVDGGGGDPDPTKVLSMIEILQQPAKKTYNDGDTFDPTGIEVEATFEGEHGDEYEDVTSLVTYSPTSMTLGVTKVTASYTYDGVTKTADITGIVVNASSWATYTEATSIADIHIGATYVISGIKDSASWVMTTTQNANNRSAEAATMASGKIRETSTIQKFELVEGTTSGTFGFKAINGTTAGQYLCATTASGNHVRSEATLAATSSWSIVFTSGVPAVTAQAGAPTILRFNSTNANPGPIFACYTSGQAAVSLHVDETTIPVDSFGTLDHIIVNTANAKTSYFVGEDFSADGLIVTAYDANGYDKIIVTYSVNKADGYEFVVGDIGTVQITVTGTVDGVNKTANYNVTIVAARLLAKVDSMDKVDTDRIYTLATKDGALGTPFTTFANDVDIKHDDVNNRFNEVTNLQTIKLEAGHEDAEGSYAIKLENGANAGKYYGWTSGNTLALDAEIKVSSSWFITITEGAMKIVNAFDDERFIAHNREYTRFAAYTGGTAAVLYTVTTLDEIAVDAFVTNFMHPEIETTDVGTGECISEGYYAAAKAAFNGMTATQRALFVSDYEAPRARLVAWAIANGDVLNASNILETPVNPAQGGIFNGLDDSNTIMLIVLISLVSVSVLAGAFYLRKREQN